MEINDKSQIKSNILQNNQMKNNSQMNIEHENVQKKNLKNNIKNINSSIFNESTNISLNENSTREGTKIETTQKIPEKQRIEMKEGNDKIEKYLIYTKEEDKSNFINCIHCKREIKTKSIDKYKLNCLNIRCPYPDCDKFFFMSICPKCQFVSFIPKLIFEGEMIKCLSSSCSFSYLQTCCPVRSCQEMFYFSNPKNFNNSPNGILHSHKSLLIFQKISCFFCYKPIVYFTTGKDQINRYYETMRISCPYDDCHKSFNRIICPKCNEVIYLKLGIYIMGTRIKCCFCSFIFAKILCPSCLKINPLIKNVFKYNEFECRYNSCSKKCLIANCIHCQRINYFNYDEKNKKRTLIPGQVIKCGYKDCNKKFCSVICSGCNEINPFPKGDFAFGKPYKCKYSAICNKIFIILVCPKCFNYSRIFDDSEGKKYTCNVCSTLLANFQCPFCLVSILDKDSFFIFGQMIECPCCKKKFSFFRCWDCRKLIYSKENECILGKSVKCNCCKKYSVNVICPKCCSKITFSKRMDNASIGEKISCPNCQTSFKFSDKLENGMEKLYNKNLLFLTPLEGLTINFGNSTVDENFIERKKNILDQKELYDEKSSLNSLMINNELDSDKKMSEISTGISAIDENDFKEKLNEKIKTYEKMNKDLCIICQSNHKESIFFPCGHRCSCYKCAVYYFEVYKKCPRCKQNALGIIPKIYDV